MILASLVETHDREEVSADDTAILQKQAGTEISVRPHQNHVLVLALGEIMCDTEDTDNVMPPEFTQQRCQGGSADILLGLFDLSG